MRRALATLAREPPANRPRRLAHTHQSVCAHRRHARRAAAGKQSYHLIAFIYTLFSPLFLFQLLYSSPQCAPRPLCHQCWVRTQLQTIRPNLGRPPPTTSSTTTGRHNSLSYLAQLLVSCRLSVCVYERDRMDWPSASPLDTHAPVSSLSHRSQSKSRPPPLLSNRLQSIFTALSLPCTARRRWTIVQPVVPVSWAHLSRLLGLAPTPLEHLESLESLTSRFRRCQTALTPQDPPPPGLDLASLEEWLSSDGEKLPR